METKEVDVIKIMRTVSIIGLILCIILMFCAKSEVVYSTEEYWVAKDFHHVYDKSSGEIVDLITENESCKIKEDEIIVTTTNHALYNWGSVIAIICGLALVIDVIEDYNWRKSQNQ